MRNTKEKKKKSFKIFQLRYVNVTIYTDQEMRFSCLYYDAKKMLLLLVAFVENCLSELNDNLTRR